MDNDGADGTLANETSPSSEFNKLEHVEQSMILLIVCVIIVASLCSHRVLKKYDIKWMSESATTILVGLAVGTFLYFCVGGYKDAVHFDEDTFSYFILPPIIFEAGFSLRHKGVVENIVPIFTLAMIGTIITAITIGLLIYAISKSYFTELYHRPVWECMCFGAVLSAIDPVAVISVLGKMFAGKTPPKIFYVIFGESVLNDAVAIVLYKVFLRFLKEDKSPDAESVFAAIGVFLEITVASVLIGWVVAAISAVLIKYIRFGDTPVAEVAIMLLFGFGSYYVAEACKMSGIMALFVCGRTSCHYTWHNMSTIAQVTAPQLFHLMATLAEAYVFSFLGLAFWSFKHDWNFGFTFLVLLTLFFSRALTVFPLVSLTNYFARPSRRISMRSQVFMALTGLRGAISFGLALSSHSSGTIKTGDQFVSTTLIIIVISVFSFGNFSEYLFDFLGCRQEANQEAALNELRTSAARPSSESPSESPQGNKDPELGNSVTGEAPGISGQQDPPEQGTGCLERCLNIERRYIAPLLRVTDHHTKHERRYNELGIVLDELQDKYDIRRRPSKAPSVDSQEFSGVAMGPTGTGARTESHPSKNNDACDSSRPAVE